MSWADVVPIDALGLEVGYRLIPLVDRGQDGELLRRIRGLRKKFAADMGFLVPAVHIRDNLELRPNAYRITLEGRRGRAAAKCFPGMFLAINPGPRARARCPARRRAIRRSGCRRSGSRRLRARTRRRWATPWWMRARWSLPTCRASSRRTAAELLGREETQALLDHLAKEAPKLVEDVVPKLLPLVHAAEGAAEPARPRACTSATCARILETLAEHAPRTQDADELTAAVRVALSRAILQHVFGGARELEVFTLDPQLEQMLPRPARRGAPKGPGSSRGWRSVCCARPASSRSSASSSDSPRAAGPAGRCAACWRASCGAPRRS